jgi:hypothetical protein
MSVPDFQTLMLPVLRELADGREKKHAVVREPIAKSLKRIRWIPCRTRHLIGGCGIHPTSRLHQETLPSIEYLT